MNKCKHTEGFYIKVVEARIVYYDSEGNPDGSNDGEHARGGRGGKVAYCQLCDRRLGRFGYNPLTDKGGIVKTGMI